MPRRRFGLVAFASILAAGCSRAGSEPQAPTNPLLTRVALERTPCFGWCPQYEVSATADGRVTFRGLHRWRGIAQEWRIAPEAVAVLGRAFLAADFFSLGDVVPGAPACGAVATDHPSIVLSASEPNREHRVNYYTGCAGTDGASAPAALQALANRLDSVTGAARVVDSLQAARTPAR
ncbi:MAG TPA: DUF6438 domain-containing protein [Gemmatimonadales bacterium]|nr:DUF6438 domain-containing protein [Gemmatimonadales bacterium]